MPQRAFPHYLQDAPGDGCLAKSSAGFAPAKPPERGDTGTASRDERTAA